MKKIGLVLIALGIALLIFVAYNFIKDSNQVISPLPEKEGVKVILITPSN